MPGDEVAALTFLNTGRVSFKDPDDPALEGRVRLQESSVMAPLAQWPVGDVSFAAGMWAGWTRLDFTGYPGLETEDLYGLALLAYAERPIRGNWGWLAMLMPGYFTDFHKGRTGEGKMVAHAAADYRFSSKLRLNIGAAYDTAFGDPQVYPVGGVVWKMSDDWTLRLVLPSPAVQWRPGSKMSLFAFVNPAGDRWIVDDEKEGEQVFLIELWRAGVGAEWRLWKSLWLRAAGGMEFGRRYEVRSGGDTLLDETVDDTWFGSVSLVVD